MINIKTFRLTLFALALLLGSVSLGNANRIAILPVEDLSQGGNGVNFTTTHILGEILRDKGFFIADHEDVISFMVKNRVRWLGQLSSPYIRRLQEELQVEYLLLGSFSQRRESPSIALSLNLQLIRTKDARIVWSSSAELNDAEQVSLLGLSKQMDMEEIEKRVAEKALSSIPVALEPAPAVEVQHRIESVHLTPQMVKPGKLIHCRIKLEGSPSTLVQTTISFFIDEQIIEAQYNEGENAFIASWPAGTADKHYAVSATIKQGKVLNREIRVGHYCVDGRAPELNLQVIGQELNGIVILQKQIQILPQLKNPEPINRWQMTVRDENGNQVMGDKGDQGLPSHFSWWGQGKNGGLVQDGFYAIDLTVWDRAGNSASTQESIRVVRAKPNMILDMEKQEDNLAINLKYDGEIPLAYWRLQIRNPNGSIIAERSGTDSSQEINLPLKATATQDISYRLYAQDMLGNHLQRDETPVSSETETTEETEDTDSDFLADLEGKQLVLGGVWAEDF
jgi:TolB-like protein